jgi:hypothetical protein
MVVKGGNTWSLSLCGYALLLSNSFQFVICALAKRISKRKKIMCNLSIDFISAILLAGSVLGIAGFIMFMVAMVQCIRSS